MRRLAAAGRQLSRRVQGNTLCVSKQGHFLIRQFHLGMVAHGIPEALEQLLERLYGVSYDGLERSIDAHIKNLRQKLEDDPQNPRYIHTVRGKGYKFSA